MIENKSTCLTQLPHERKLIIGIKFHVTEAKFGKVKVSKTLGTSDQDFSKNVYPFHTAGRFRGT